MEGRVLKTRHHATQSGREGLGTTKKTYSLLAHLQKLAERHARVWCKTVIFPVSMLSGSIVHVLVANGARPRLANAIARDVVALKLI